MAPPTFPRTRRARRLGLVLILFLASILIVGLGAVGDPPKNDTSDKRNVAHGEKNGGNPALDCWSHHRGEGMYDSHVIVPIVPIEVLPNTEDVYTIQVVNSWKYYISEMLVEVSLLGNETHVLPTDAKVAEGQEDLRQSWQGEIGNNVLYSSGAPVPNSKAVLNFTVAPLPTALFARVELHPSQVANPPPGSPVQNVISAQLYPPGAVNTFFKFDPKEDPSALERTLVMDPKNLKSGDWRFELFYDSGPAPKASYSLNVTVLYAGQAGQTYEVFYSPRTPDPQNPSIPLQLVPKGGVYSVEVPVRHLTKGTQQMEIHVRANLWYKHQDGKTPDEDYFNRYATVTVVVGDKRVESAIQGATAQSLGVDARLVSGEVSGFAAAVLLLPSLLFGGTYGRASRKFFNNILGGAKRRVMFHNLISLGLTFVAVVHVVLFMLEIRYTVLMGVLWGGLGALSLLVLGLTGFYQVPLIQRYGYNWWRYTHLVFGLLVVAFVAYHTLVDGPDFDFARKAFPSDVQKFLQDFNLAYK